MVSRRIMLVIVSEISGALYNAIYRASGLISNAEHVVTFDWSPTSLELGDHLLGDAPDGIHHDVARDR